MKNGSTVEKRGCCKKLIFKLRAVASLYTIEIIRLESIFMDILPDFFVLK